METVDREVGIEIDIVECIFTINGLSIQRVDVLEKHWEIRETITETKETIIKKKNKNSK